MVEAVVFNECVSEEIIHGKKRNRGVRAHRWRYMCRVLLQQFRIWHNTEKKTSIGKVDAFVAAWETFFSNNEINGSEATMKSLIAHSDELMNDLQQYFDKHISNPTFAIWKHDIDVVSALLLFIRVDKAGDFNLHLSTFKQIILPWMMIIYHRKLCGEGNCWII